jgi:hypothetical protein
MAALPSTPLILTGGCYCGAIKYTAEIPKLEDRPLVPGALVTVLTASHPREEHSSPHSEDISSPVTLFTPTRLPLIPLDHCSTCRRLLGGIVQCWIILPQTWVNWDLLSKASSSSLVSSPYTRAVLSTPDVVYSGKDFLSAFQSTIDEGTDGSVTRTFCSCCGTTLTFAFKASQGAASRSLASTEDGGGEVGKDFPALVNLTVGSLDDESLAMVRPDRHGWWDSGVGWIKDLLRKGDRGLTRHPGEDVGAIAQDDQ